MTRIEGLGRREWPADDGRVPDPHADLPIGRPDARSVAIGPRLRDFPEPSGIAWHHERGTLFLVGDRGHIAEISARGKLLRSEKVGKLDFEGVTVGPEGRVYAVVEEKPPRLLEIDPDTLEVRRELEIDRDFEGKRVICRRPNEGLEGLCWVEEDRAFYAVNQDAPPRIVRLVLPEDGKKKVRIDRVIDLEKAVDNQANGLAYDPASRHFLVTESGGDRAHGAVHEVTRKGKLVRSIPLDADHPEGLALDGRGAAFVAQDGGRILRID